MTHTFTHRYFLMCDDGIDTYEVFEPLRVARDDRERARICEDMNRELQKLFCGAFGLRFDATNSCSDFRRKVFLFCSHQS